MSPGGKQKVIVIVGPTASGKSDLGVAIAKQIHGEIISADSRQVYKGLDIGSGKITKKEMRGIPHYGLDIVAPRKTFTTEDFKKYGEKVIQQISQKEKTPIIVGGTGFYIDTLLGRMNTASVPPNPRLRKKLEKKSTEQLFLMLKKLDPVRAETVDKNNPRRLIRAIEIERAKEQNIPSLILVPPARDENEQKSKFVILWLGVKRSPEELKKRIHSRLLKRLEGIIKEVKSLHKSGLSWKRMNDLGLEYRYVSMFAQKQISKKEMIKKLELEIWHYARRQMTWFRKNKEINWVTKHREAKQLIKSFQENKRPE